MLVELFDSADLAPTVRRVTLGRLSSEMARALAGIGKIAVEGEVYRPSTRPGGRIYFTLKDRASQIDVTVPSTRSRRARVVNGERVLVTGVLEWANSWGRVQLVAEEVVPVGAGAVAAMIAEARARLRAEGLIDRPRRPIPRLPAAIGVVCGSEAAVRADILSVVAARFPRYPMVFREVTVSGPGAVDAVIGAIRDLDEHPDVDVIILARGGGDATQLLPFSDEELCRAICASSTPVVSAIGHDGDRPLCDDVADLRCGTPSLAAGAVVPDRAAIESGLAAAWDRAAAVLERRVADAGVRLAGIDRDRAITTGVERARSRLAAAHDRLALVHPRRRIDPSANRLAAAAREMEALSPVRVLERGYAIVRGGGGRVLRSTEGLRGGEPLDVELASGRLRATVDEIEHAAVEEKSA